MNKNDEQCFALLRAPSPNTEFFVSSNMNLEHCLFYYIVCLRIHHEFNCPITVKIGAEQTMKQT